MVSDHVLMASITVSWLLRTAFSSSSCMPWTGVFVLAICSASSFGVCAKYIKHLVGVSSKMLGECSGAWHMKVAHEEVRGRSGGPERPRTIYAWPALAGATPDRRRLLGGGLRRVGLAGQQRGGGLRDLIRELALAGEQLLREVVAAGHDVLRPGQPVRERQVHRGDPGGDGLDGVHHRPDGVESDLLALAD